MTHRPNIHMRLRTLKLRLAHDVASFVLSVIVSLFGYSWVWAHSPRTRFTISDEIASGTC